MGMTIRNNISSLNAQRILRNTLNDYNKSMEKLSSGYKINRAADDAAGLAISERMRTQIRGLKVASGNASNGIELCKIADGALEQVQNMLQRMSDLAIHAQDGATSAEDAAADQAEANELIKEITRIADTTKFNGKTLLDGTLKTDGINFMVGYTAADANKINLKIEDMTSKGLGLATGDPGTPIDLKTAASLTTIQTAIQTVSTNRATIGATQNRLDYTVKNLDTIRENTASAESRIRDVDVAEEEANATAMQLLYNSGISTLMKSMQNQQSLLNLLG